MEVMMSDKGREAIADIISDAKENPVEIGDLNNRLDKYEKYLRSHGWIHENDAERGRHRAALEEIASNDRYMKLPKEQLKGFIEGVQFIARTALNKEDEG
jgi:hypothetical protein